jgi:hypothetical protein
MQRVSVARWRAPYVVVVVAAVLAAGLGFVRPGPARADTVVADPDTIEATAQYVSQQTGAGDLPCEEGCEKLVADAATQATDDIGASRTGGGLFRGFMDVVHTAAPRLLPLLNDINVTADLITANYVVWWHVFNAHPVNFYIRVAPDPTIGSWAMSIPGDPSSSSLFLSYHGPPDPVPFGMVAVGRGRGAVLWQTTESSYCNEPAPAPPSGPIEEVTWHWNDCWVGSYDSNGMPVTVPDIAHTWNVPGWYAFGDGLLDNYTPGTGLVINQAGDQNLSAADVRQRVADILGDHTDYGTVIDWATSVVQDPTVHNPRYGYATVPDCTGVSVDDCKARLQAAGFSGGNVVTRELSSDDAAMSVAPGQVTDVYPRSGDPAETRSDFTLTVNPDDPAPETAEETAVASQLEQQNPDTITDDNKDQIARECIKYLQAAGKNGDDCTSVPLFVTGDDARGPADNDIAKPRLGAPEQAVSHAYRRQAMVYRPAWLRDRHLAVHERPVR